MAVLIEGISIVIRCDAILKNYYGGLAKFTSTTPNQTLRADGILAGISFMRPEDARSYVDHLEEHGLKHLGEGEAVDLVIVDQFTGIHGLCSWGEFGFSDWNNDPQKPIAVCMEKGSRVQKIVVPNGWSFDSSLSAHGKFVRDGGFPETLKFIRHEQGVDIYFDEETGKELYVGRTRPPNSSA